METIVVKDQQPIAPTTLAGSSSKVKGKLAIAFIVCYLSIMFSGISPMLMSVYLPVAVKDLLGNVTGEKMNNVGAYIGGYGNAVFIFSFIFLIGLVSTYFSKDKTKTEGAALNT